MTSPSFTCLYMEMLHFGCTFTCEEIEARVFTCRNGLVKHLKVVNWPFPKRCSVSQINCPGLQSDVRLRDRYQFHGQNVCRISNSEIFSMLRKPMIIPDYFENDSMLWWSSNCKNVYKSLSLVYPPPSLFFFLITRHLYISRYYISHIS